MSKDKFRKKKKDRNKETIELEAALKTRKWEYDFQVDSKYTFSYNQQSLIESITGPDTSIAFVDGPAGSAKTYIAVLAALKLLSQRKLENIVYIRSVVESASKGIGFLPGEIDDKFGPWSMPLNDKLEELVSPEVIKNLKSTNVIKCLPVNFARGLTFRNSFVIVDEAQNMTFQELTTLLTRVGENSKYVICGDTMQSDINGHSGFKKMYTTFSTEECAAEGIQMFNFDESCIVRSKILRFIISRLKHAT